MKNTNILVQHAGARPVWLRVPEAVRLFGLSRSLLYEMIKARTIKSVCIRKREAKLGVRLISFSSLNDFIERAADGGEMD